LAHPPTPAKTRRIRTTQAILGVNGTTQLLNNTQIDGHFYPFGGLEAEANVEVERSFVTAADVVVYGNVNIDGDMNIGGNLEGIGAIDVDGTFRLGGTNSFLGWLDVGNQEPIGSPPSQPCDCRPDQQIDIAGAIARAKSTNNNGASGLGTQLSNLGYTDLRLSSGTYYFSDATNIGFVRITIEGTVALFLDGDLDTIGAERIKLAAGSTLDLYVGGNIRSVGHVELGDKSAPASFRLYIGGSDDVTLSVGNAQFNGALYAPNAIIEYIGNTNIRGSLFARRVTGTGNLVVGYAEPEPAPIVCPDPEDLPPPGDPNEPDPPTIL